jgi:hypothetical protein
MGVNIQIPGSPFAGGSAVQFSVGTPTLSFQIVGALSSGSYQGQISNDGSTWVNVGVYTSDNALVSTVTAAGMYRVDVNGYQNFRLAPSSVVGTHVIYAIGSSTQLPFVAT